MKKTNKKKEQIELKGSFLTDPRFLLCLRNAEGREDGSITAVLKKKDMDEEWDYTIVKGLLDLTIFCENRSEESFWVSHIFESIKDGDDVIVVYFNRHLGQPLFRLKEKIKEAEEKD